MKKFLNIEYIRIIKVVNIKELFLVEKVIIIEEKEI